MKNLLIRGNVKMGKNVFLFNLPPDKTCTPTDWCLHGKNGKPFCYARRNNFLLPNVIHGAIARFEISKRNNFVEKIVDEIHRNKPKYFRLHSSGDFYSDEYAEKIFQIVSACPKTLFRTSTRRRDLADSIKKIANLPNIIIRESLDYERTEPVMGLPFAALSYLDIVKKERSYHCPHKCEKCGYYCWKNNCNINFDEY